MQRRSKDSDREDDNNYNSNDNNYNNDSDDNDDDDEDWTEEQPCRCLFCSEISSLPSTLNHMKAAHRFDLPSLKQSLHLDFYASIKLINFIRSEAAQQPVIAPTFIDNLKDQLATNKNLDFLHDDRFLIPVIPEDPLLFGDTGGGDDSDEETKADAPIASTSVFSASSASSSFSSSSSSNTASPSSALALQALQRENSMLREQVVALQERMAQMSTTLRRVALGEESDEKREPTSSSLSSGSSLIEVDKGYFAGYSYRDIHELMLKDRVRTVAYRDLFYENKEHFAGKIVLDVGCGTGILCLFAARAGAKRVIGIDRADIIDKAREIVRANHYDHVITLIKSKVEEAVLPPDVATVDVIVSEWMGYFLLFESMLPSVLFARDKWLAKPHGLVYPDTATMFVAAVHDQANIASKIDFWKDVYGFDMSLLIDDRDRFCDEGVVEFVDPSAVISQPAVLQQFEIQRVTNASLDFEQRFSLSVTHDAMLAGLCVWFDTGFSASLPHPTVLTTSPFRPQTHWKQTTFYLAKPFPVKVGDMVLAELHATRRAANPRDYDVTIRVQRPRTDTDADSWQVQDFTVKTDTAF